MGTAPNSTNPSDPRVRHRPLDPVATTIIPPRNVGHHSIPGFTAPSGPRQVNNSKRGRAPEVDLANKRARSSKAHFFDSERSTQSDSRNRSDHPHDSPRRLGHDDEVGKSRASSPSRRNSLYRDEQSHVSRKSSPSHENRPKMPTAGGASPRIHSPTASASGLSKMDEVLTQFNAEASNILPKPTPTPISSVSPTYADQADQRRLENTTLLLRQLTDNITYVAAQGDRVKLAKKKSDKAVTERGSSMKHHPSFTESMQFQQSQSDEIKRVEEKYDKHLKSRENIFAALAESLIVPTPQSQDPSFEADVKDFKAKQNSFNQRLDDMQGRVDHIQGKVDQLCFSLGDVVKASKHAADDITNLKSELEGLKSSSQEKDARLTRLDNALSGAGGAGSGGLIESVSEHETALKKHETIVTDLKSEVKKYFSTVEEQSAHLSRIDRVLDGGNGPGGRGLTESFADHVTALKEHEATVSHLKSELKNYTSTVEEQAAHLTRLDHALDGEGGSGSGGLIESFADQENKLKKHSEVMTNLNDDFGKLEAEFIKFDHRLKKSNDRERSTTSPSIASSVTGIPNGVNEAEGAEKDKAIKKLEKKFEAVTGDLKSLHDMKSGEEELITQEFERMTKLIEDLEATVVPLKSSLSTMDTALKDLKAQNVGLEQKVEKIDVRLETIANETKAMHAKLLYNRNSASSSMATTASTNPLYAPPSPFHGPVEMSTPNPNQGQSPFPSHPSATVPSQSPSTTTHKVVQNQQYPLAANQNTAQPQNQKQYFHSAPQHNNLIDMYNSNVHALNIQVEAMRKQEHNFNMLSALQAAITSLERRYSNITTEQVVKAMVDQMRAIWPHAANAHQKCDIIQHSIQHTQNQLSKLQRDITTTKQDTDKNNVSDVELRNQFVEMKGNVGTLVLRLEHLENLADDPSEGIPHLRSENHELSAATHDLKETVRKLQDSAQRKMNSDALEFGRLHVGLEDLQTQVNTTRNGTQTGVA